MRENRRVQNLPMRLDIELSRKKSSDPIEAKIGFLLHLSKHSTFSNGVRLSFGADGLDTLMGALQ